MLISTQQSFKSKNKIPNKKNSLFTPLTFKPFRIIWFADLIANLGTWAQSVASVWILTEFHASSITLAMIQVVTALPLVLLSIISGVWADNYDRRKLMLMGMFLEFTGGALITSFAFIGYLTSTKLILSILGMSIGASLAVPAWQAAINEQVSKNQVTNAVILNSVNYNFARAVGPIIGGILINTVGTAWVFLLNCLCYLGLIWAVWQWKQIYPKRILPPEHIFEGVISALKFAKYSKVMRSVMLRSFVFGLSASALWALLPVLANTKDSIYGYMLGALGTGAIIGSAIVNKLCNYVDVNKMISSASLLLSIVMLLIGSLNIKLLIFGVLMIGGSCWITVLASYNSSVQMLVPDWVKARALALYQTMLYAGLAIGSFCWGHIASIINVNFGLKIAGLLLLTTTIALINFKLPKLDEKYNSVMHQNHLQPKYKLEFSKYKESIIVSIEYCIPCDKTNEFINLIIKLRNVRLRNGAKSWALYRNVAAKEIWQEIFLIRNWLCYLRMLSRITIADKIIIDKVNKMHLGLKPPRTYQGIQQIKPKK
ncbi:Putative transmembrane secretion effector [Candidatus Portiera aleyrodidarum]|uniref:Transmembrane secretion effector n=1 Tax=Candidatus Portiera aleyrodidarum TaxID=91844 RepID=A0A6S6RZZ5_9GAMM|nr:MFS transporter [Candidatus Portiera aleyrodidarum]CAA3708340.1 Putative transmembrane secretion effector [Candidatus Portiera aleyrodidarum]